MKTRSLSRRRLIQSAIAGGSLALLPGPAAWASDYPGSKSIRLVVPFPPGGGADLTGRWIAQALGQELKGTVIVENLPGATGTMGSARVARAEPDGYTLLIGISATHAIAPALLKDVPYRPDRDFTPLARIAQGGNLFVVHPSLPAKTVGELIAIARRPGSDLVYGSWGIGSGGHLAMEAVNLHAGTRVPHVPYKGVGPLLQDLIGGSIRMGVVDLATGMPQVRAGKLRAIAVSGPTRSAQLPEVPTLVEQGVPFDTASWYAVFGPAKMPAPLVERLDQALGKVLATPEAAERIRALGMEPDPITRVAFERQVREDMTVWAGIIERGGIRAE